MKKKKINKIEIFLSVIAISIVTVIGMVLLAVERSEQNVIMIPETEYIENPASEEMTKDLKININTAPKEELVFLDGIGEKRAEDIIAYRKKTPFKSKEEIMNIKGIGKATFNKIADKIYVE